MRKRARSVSEEEFSATTVSTIGDRTIILAGEIDEPTAGEFLACFLELDQSNGPINVVLVSPGGDEYAGFAIYDAIRCARNQVIVRAYGEVMSIGALIFMAGDERRMSPECRFMVHQGSVDLGKQELNIMWKRAEEYKVLDDRYISIISERSGVNDRVVRCWVKDETFLSAKECVDFGIAHCILKGPKS